MRSGRVYVHPTQARRIDESASSSWPTPDAAGVNDGESPESWLERKRRNAEKEEDPTRAGIPLAMAVRVDPVFLKPVRFWPTPVTTDASSAARHTTQTGVMHAGTTLTDAVRMWATPTARDEKGPGPTHTKGGRDLATDVAMQVTEKANSARLNPDWVETLMGFPIGWTRIAGQPPPGRSSSGSHRGSSSVEPEEEGDMRPSTPDCSIDDLD